MNRLSLQLKNDYIGGVLTRGNGNERKTDGTL